MKIAAVLIILAGAVAAIFAMFKYEHLHDREAAISDCVASDATKPCAQLRYYRRK